MRTITLTTDFGTRDWFVGTMKGVILGFAPRVNIVDLTHEIPPGDVRGGAFALAASCRFFPKGTVHVAVVDPGVGSAQPAIAVQTTRYFFIGPDNGVLSLALEREAVKAIHRLTNTAFFLKPVSRTFHGRDVFAPAAAQLSRGVPIAKFGRRVRELMRLEWPKPIRRQTGITGEVIYVDRFGNAITNLDEQSVSASAGNEVFLGRRRLCRINDSYGAVPPGEAVAVIGSSGLLEIATNGGSAAAKFGLKLGDWVEVRCR